MAPSALPGVGPSPYSAVEGPAHRVGVTFLQERLSGSLQRPWTAPLCAGPLISSRKTCFEKQAPGVPCLPMDGARPRPPSPKRPELRAGAADGADGGDAGLGLSQQPPQARADTSTAASESKRVGAAAESRPTAVCTLGKASVHAVLLHSGCGYEGTNPHFSSRIVSRSQDTHLTQNTRLTLTGHSAHTHKTHTLCSKDTCLILTGHMPHAHRTPHTKQEVGLFEVEAHMTFSRYILIRMDISCICAPLGFSRHFPQLSYFILRVIL